MLAYVCKRATHILGSGMTYTYHIHTDAWFIEDLSNRDATVIVVKINNRQTLIGSLYFDYTESVIQPG